MQATVNSVSHRAKPPRPIAIRCEPDGYGVRFGLTEAEDERLPGPVFETLPEALAFVAALDEAKD
jgi:hypothetical protein